MGVFLGVVSVSVGMDVLLVLVVLFVMVVDGFHKFSAVLVLLESEGGPCVVFLEV